MISREIKSQKEADNKPAYVISYVEVKDREGLEDYRNRAKTSIEKYGGKYLARSAKPEIAEGEVTKRRIVLVQFPSLQRLHEWYNSPEYLKAREIAKVVLDRQLLFIEGI